MLKFLMLMLVLVPSLSFAQDASEEEEITPAEDIDTDSVPVEEPTDPTEPAATVEESNSVSTSEPEVSSEPPPEEPEQLVKINAETNAEKQKRIFGSYKIRLGGAYPTLSKEPECYKKLYGDANIYPQLGVDYYFFDWYMTLGLSFNMAYYKDHGKAIANPAPGVGCAQLQRATEKTELTWIPLQVLAAAQITPFQRKWLVIDLWAGPEMLFFQETRLGAETESSAGAIRMMAEASSDEDDSLTNQGWKSGMVVGAAANILISPLDEASSLSLDRAVGLRSIYLSPFFQVVRSTQSKGINWGRNIIGVAFSFESSL
jgi:hypothetical protein